MSDINRLPSEQPGLDELPDALRRAVEHIRSQPVPQESLQRALDRASAINIAPARRWFHLRPEIQVRIAIAAAILVALAVGSSANVLEDRADNRLNRIGSSSEEFAFVDEPPTSFAPRATWKRLTEDERSNKATFGAVTDGMSRTMDVSESSDPSTRRPAGINGIFADGSVHGIKQGVDPEVLKQLNGRASGAPTDRGPVEKIGPPGQLPESEKKLSGGILAPRSAGSEFKPPYGGFPALTPESGESGQAPANSNTPQMSMMNKMIGGRPVAGKSLDFAGAPGGGGGGFGFGPGPLQRPQSGPLNNGSLQPGFVSGFPDQFGGFGGNGGFGGSFAGGGFGGSFGGGGFGSQGWNVGTSVTSTKKVKKTSRSPDVLDLDNVEIREDRLAVSPDDLRLDQLSERAALKGKELKEHWSWLSEADRSKSLDDLTRELPARYKERVTTYFNSLDKSKADKTPQVWHRDGQRPTFARVYLGGGDSLELVSLQVSVTVEGPRARTVVDHIFHNPHDRQLEGTFEYPLPTGASVSYFGMFQGQNRPNVPQPFGQQGQAPPLPGNAAHFSPSDMAHQVSAADWGALQEARVVSKQKALETYEDIVRTRIDPALLEYSGGNTFTGRVFPIQPKGYNRVLIAYEELLPIVGDHAVYHFPLPNCKLSEMQVTLQANEADFTEPVFYPKEAKRETGGGRVVYSHTWKNYNPVADATRLAKGAEATQQDKEVVFAGLPARAQLQAITGRQGDSGPTYLYARVRPQLKVETGRPFADHAIFLLDTSLSEHPDRFAVSMKLWQQILQSDPGIKQFNILAFNVGTSWIEPKGWLDNTPEGRAKALARLDGIVLEGATDLSAALGQLVTPGANLTRNPLPYQGRGQGDRSPLARLARGKPLDVFLLSDGQVTWGDRDTNSLVARFEAGCPYSVRFHCYPIGLGAENIELFQALTRRGGGIYPCYSEAYLPAAARAHRNHCLLIERVSFRGGPGGPGHVMSDVLVAGRQAAVYPGGDLIVAARANLTPAPPSLAGKGAGGLGHTKLIVEGTFLGERVVYEYPIEITSSSELAGRGWGELAVSSLLALNDPKLDSLVTAYCQQFGIGSRVASFLVLENPADYKRLNLEEERGKVVPGGDLEKFLDDAWRNLARVIRPKQAFQEFLNKAASRIAPADPSNPDLVRKLMALLTDKDFELPETTTGEAIVHKKDVSPTYLAARQADPMNVHVYLDEAKRRANDKNASSAIRVLSSVVEAFPTRADALRLVGYRLLDLQQPTQAVRLFQQIEESRPFEPHSYRDLARSLEESGQYGFAALQYEMVLAGAWHGRFRDSLKEVAREEYAHMMQEALRETRNPKSEIRISKELADYFGERLEGMASIRQQADLRVTVSWNTDNTDVDLWVLEPDGTKCFYQNQKTSSGGQLSQDQTQGYGPERYQVQKALPGMYTVVTHYYRADVNLLACETHVNVLVTKHAGTPEETVERHTVLLKQANEQVEVCKVRIR
jgi:hypothetical protein